MFSVLEGQVELRKGSRTLMVLGPEGIFGEMAILESMPRSADAFALTDCRIAVVNQKRFMQVVSQAPFFAIQMLRLLSERLRRQNEIG